MLAKQRRCFVNCALITACGLVLLLTIASPTQSSAQAFSTIYNFCTQSGCPDGSAPNGWLTQGDDGSFYGTTGTGGANGFGTVFKISRLGVLTTLHSFNNTDGNGPSALIRATDGNFYGTTSSGGGTCSRGTNTCGTVFRVTPGGILTTLYTFCAQTNCPDGFFPLAALIQGKDGNLYGTTSEGGSGTCEGFGCGTIFRITLVGTLTTLYKFCPVSCSTNPRDGANPSAALVQGADGDFYGTTAMGGGGSQCSFGCGTIFRFSLNGMLTTLHAFNSSDGLLPTQLIQAIDGNYYGTTAGSLFEYRADGVFMNLHTFQLTDGETPLGMLQATDGNFYGTTSQGANNACPLGCGTVFKLSLSGVFSTLHAFNGSDGFRPTGGLLEATDGSFYGTTSQGGSSNNCPNGCGTVFRMTVGLIPFLTASPTFGNVGDQVTVLGTNLTGATSVAFNGTLAAYNVVSDSKITATVPAGATTGRIEVTKPGATLFTFTDYQVVGPFQFYPVTPCRLIDTRQPGQQPIQGGTTRNFLVSQLGGCGIPNSAAAYSLNVTISPHGHLNYITVWPEGEIRPNASLMNSSDGRIKANAAIVPSGNNAISIFSTDTTDVILDANGYFSAPGAGSYQFYTVTPCRIVDTRGNHDGGTLQPGVERDYAIPPNCGVPSYATAYSFNVTVLPTQGNLPYLTVWPQGESMPNTSTLNDYTGTIVANAAIVPAGPNNTTAFEPFQKPTDLLLDVNGYFAPAGASGLNMYPAAPCRVLDTRLSGSGFSGPMPVNVVGSPCAPPANAMAYIFNATVVPPGPMLFLTLWPDGEMRPNASTLNALDGFITSNMAIVPTTNGSIDAYASAVTQLILDISGYFAP